MAASGLNHYLLVFDHNKGELIEETLFRDSAKAVASYTDCEERYRGHDRIEVVLIASDSIETIQRTHANYFDGSVAEQTSRFLVGI